MPATPRQVELSVSDAMYAIGPLLPQLTRRLRARAESGPEGAFIQRDGLGARHGTALGLLVFRSMTVGEIAKELRLSLPTVSGVVADLDRAGIVERRPDPADRRRTIVTIANARRPEVEAWLRRSTLPVLDVLEQLTSDERIAWVKAMDMLVSRLGPESAAPSPPTAPTAQA